MFRIRLNKNKMITKEEIIQILNDKRADESTEDGYKVLEFIFDSEFEDIADRILEKIGGK